MIVVVATSPTLEKLEAVKSKPKCALKMLFLFSLCQSCRDTVKISQICRI